MTADSCEETATSCPSSANSSGSFLPSRKTDPTPTTPKANSNDETASMSVSTGMTSWQPYHERRASKSSPVQATDTEETAQQQKLRCQRRRSKSPKPPVPNKFLHSGELMPENSENNDDDEQSCARCGWRVDKSDKKTQKLAFQNWPRRHVYRSMSVDDMLEYQRKFNNKTSHSSHKHRHICGDSLAFDVADHRQDYQLLFAEHKPIMISTFTVGNTEAEADHQRIRPKGKLIVAQNSGRFAASRKSIANSDLHEFKRQKSQNQMALKGEEGIMAIMNNEHNFGDLSDSENTADERNNEDNDKRNYQWGTQSVPKASLGSDLTKFQRNVKTALLVSSRENSNDNLSCGDGIDSTIKGKTTNSSSNVPEETAAALSALDEENWGTRSLRRTIQRLELIDDSYAYYVEKNERERNEHQQLQKHHQKCETVYEEDTGMPQHFPSPLRSPWLDEFCRSNDNTHKRMQPRMPCRVVSREDLKSSSPTAVLVDAPSIPRRIPATKASAQGLKMPKRVVSVNSPDCGLKVPRRVISDDSSGNNREREMASLLARDDGPDLTRYPLRRSMSSSDIEKYQRHLADSASTEQLSKQAGESKGSETSENGSLLHTASASRKTFIEMGSRGNTDPLLQGDSQQTEEGSTSSNAGKKKHRHRRSTSDVPEFHMNGAISDVAPRKPRRSNSRSDEDSFRSVDRPYVRFAEHKTTVFEIPKVSEEMKPVLFYNKSDVQRFRMNEHKRQEMQIREYMGYLNQKQHSLKHGSPTMFD